MHHHPLAGTHTRDLGADLRDDPGELMPERHGLPARSGQSAEADVGEVTAADAAGVYLDESIPRTAGRHVYAINRHRPW